MSLPRLTSSALAAVVCCGCASAPLRYHSLTTAPTSSGQDQGASCCIVEMRNVLIPVEVDRPELVARQSDEEFDVLGNDVWLAPLRDEIKAALLDHIRRRLSGTAESNTAPAPRRFIVVLDVERFESVLGRHALIQAQWQVTAAGAPKTAATAACETTVSIAVPDGVAALVLGHQQAIAEIADRIAANIIEPVHTGTAPCLG